MCLGFVGVMVAMWFVVMLLEEAISLFYNNVKTAGRPMSAKQFKHFYNTISIIRSCIQLTKLAPGHIGRILTLSNFCKLVVPGILSKPRLGLVFNHAIQYCALNDRL